MLWNMFLVVIFFIYDAIFIAIVMTLYVGHCCLEIAGINADASQRVAGEKEIVRWTFGQNQAISRVISLCNGQQTLSIRTTHIKIARCHIDQTVFILKLRSFIWWLVKHMQMLCIWFYHFSVDVSIYLFIFLMGVRLGVGVKLISQSCVWCTLIRIGNSFQWYSTFNHSGTLCSIESLKD